MHKCGFGKAWLAVCGVAALAGSGRLLADEWLYYGRDAGNSRYSPLRKITTENVRQLQPAWTFHTGDIAYGSQATKRSGFETTPLVHDGRLYLTTPYNRVIALDAASSRQLWAYDPKIDRTLAYDDGLINRGLASWRDRAVTEGSCAVRLFEATLDARLIALDAANGIPCSDFGAGGTVDLHEVKNYHQTTTRRRRRW